MNVSDPNIKYFFYITRALSDTRSHAFLEFITLEKFKFVDLTKFNSNTYRNCVERRLNPACFRNVPHYCSLRFCSLLGSGSGLVLFTHHVFQCYLFIICYVLVSWLTEPPSACALIVTAKLKLKEKHLSDKVISKIENYHLCH